jgi:uncharacterized protein
MDEAVKEILSNYKKIAIVGLSPKEDRPSFRVAKYMKESGFEICGVRPAISSILDSKVFEKLEDVDYPLEIVNIFRASNFVPAIVDQVIKLGAKVLWLQEGVTHPDAEQRAREAGIAVISNLCIKKEYARLFT